MARPRWGDEEEDEEALPARQETGADENGIKTITEYYRDNKGRAMKRTTRVKVAAIKQKVYKVSFNKKRRVGGRFCCLELFALCFSVCIMRAGRSFTGN